MIGEAVPVYDVPDMPVDHLVIDRVSISLEMDTDYEVRNFAMLEILTFWEKIWQKRAWGGTW